MEFNQEKEGSLFLPSFLYMVLAPMLFLIPLFLILIVFKDQPSLNLEYFNDIPNSHLFIAEGASKIFLIIFFIVLFFHELKQSFYKLFKEKSNIAYVVLGFIAVLVLTIIINLVYKHFEIDDIPYNQKILIEMLNSPIKPIMYFIIIIAAPLTEEIIFRKLLFSFIEKTLKLPQTVAIIISSIIFALIHVISSPSEYIFIFAYLPLSIVITISYILSKKNIAVPMSIHFLNNLLSIIQEVI